MKKSFFLVLTLTLFGSLVGVRPLRAADDATRRAQQALRDGGFYYGPVDGTAGDETTQAIRRYQIRNGLAVSGQLNAETLRSLNINAPAPAERSGRVEPTPPPLNPASRPTPPPPRATERPAATPPPPPPATRRAPSAPSVGSPPISGPAYSRPDLRAAPALPPGAQVPSGPLTGFFANTLYEFAPPAVQADVLRRAQRALGQGGFYDGPADGQPTRRTVEAIGEFQGAFRLRRTRQLDVPTLRVLRLLPAGNSNLPEPIPSRRRGDPDANPSDDDEDGPPVRIRPNRVGPEVYQGRIIR